MNYEMKEKKGLFIDSLEEYPDSCSGNLFETIDYIVVQSENGHVSVFDKADGRLILFMQCEKRGSGEQLKNMAEDFQRRRDFTRRRAII